MRPALRRLLRWPADLRELLITSIVLAAAPLLVVVLAGWRMERSRLLEAADAQVEAMASLVTMLERRRYDSARQVLAAIASAPIVHGDDRARCDGYVAGVRRAFPAFTNLGVIDPDGRIVCSAVEPPAELVLTDRAYFRETRRAPGVAAEYVIGRVTKLRALTFASRLSDADTAGSGRVVFAALDLDRAAERLRALKLPDFMQVDVTTDDGIVLASTHPDPGVLGRPIADPVLRQRIAAARAAPGDVSTAGRYATVRVIGDFRPTAVLVSARIDEQRLLAPALRHVRTELAVLLLAAALGAAAAWRLGHRTIARPVADLLLRMRRFEDGEPDEGPPPRQAAVELSALHDRFTQMRSTLRSRAHEREALLAELKQTQEKVVASQRISRIGYWEADLRTGRLGGTPHLASLLGTPIPATVQDWALLLSPADGRRLQQRLAAAWAAAGTVDLEVSMPLAGNPAGWVRVRGELRGAPDGTPERLHGSVQDITERKRAELRAAAQMGRLQLLHRITRAIADRLSIAEILQIVVAQLEEQMPLALCASAPLDTPAQAIRIDHLGARGQPSAARMGLAPGDAIPVDGDGLTRAVAGEVVYEPDTRGLPHALPARLARVGLQALVLVPLRTPSAVFGVILAAREAPESFSSTDCEFLRQLGEQTALALHQAELYTALREAYDMLQRSQASALRQERLRALGELASGIAHDINNAVSPLTLYIESLLKHEAGLSAGGREKLVTMQSAAQGIARTVERMRAFHPGPQPPPGDGRCAADAVVLQVVELTGARWRDAAQRGGATIAVVTDLQPGLPDVRVDEGDLRDALVNLVLNAVDAMPDGGTLTLRTRLAGGDPAGDPADAVELCVADTGVGMSAATRQQCLEPFFTTKGGRGTGLGLATVQATVQRYHGRLHIDTAPGAGTTVRIELPAAGTRQDGVAAASIESGDAAADGAPMRLLLVDDDPCVLGPLCDALGDDGHDVSTAPGGHEAIELFSRALQQGRPFDAVITDLGMPGVDGSQVARAVRALCPAVRVVMLTGWGRRGSGDGTPPPHVDALLSKPPRLDALRAALRPSRPRGTGVPAAPA